MWPFNLFWPKKSAPVGTPVSSKAPKEGEYFSSPEILLEVSDEKPVPLLHDLFHGAIVDADRQRQDDLEKLMSDSKLRGYFTTTIKAMAEKAMKESGTCFIGHYGCGVPERSFSTFMQIFCKTAKELGLKCSADGDMLRFDVSEVRNYLEKHSPSRVNIDERVRAMLRTGPYR